MATPRFPYPQHGWGIFFYSLVLGSCMAIPNAWRIKNLRLQMKFDNRQNGDDEEACGCSAQGMRGRGGSAATF
jgi:hypothetical protein